MDLDRALKIIKERGEGDIFHIYSKAQRARLGCLGGKYQWLDRSFRETSGYGIRVLKGGRLGFGFGNKEDEESVHSVVEHAAQAAELSEPLPMEFPNYRASEQTWVRSEADLSEAVLRAANLLSAKGITKFEVTVVREEEVWQLRNTSGGEVTTRQAVYWFTVAPVVSGNTENWNFWYQATDDPDRFNVKDLVDRALERAYSSLDGKGMSLKNVPVVFDLPEWHELWDALLPSLSGRAVERNKSYFSGKEGQEVLSKHLSLYLTCRHGQVPEAYLYDHEGVPVSPTYLVADGVFEQPYYSLSGAAEFGKKPTGVGYRPSYRQQPVEQPFIVHLQVGDLPPLDSLDKYLRITSLKGVHSGLNPVSGVFSIGADGVLIDRGERVPLSGITLSGNVWDVLKNAVAASAFEESIPAGWWLVSPLVALEGVTVTG